MYVCMYVCMYGCICMYVCMYVCMHVCVYISLKSIHIQALYLCSIQLTECITSVFDCMFLCQVGCGKSSLISALIGQMYVGGGSVSRVEAIAYVTQHPWIRNASLRENILFGMPYDKHKYDTIVCSSRSVFRESCDPFDLLCFEMN